MPADTPAAFFSYCREDSDFALRLAEDLKAVGANVWMDQLDIEPGTPWDRAIEDALTNCPCMLVILSPVSVKSDNVRDEVSFALSKQKRVIPVLYRDCDVPFRVARLQHIDFRADYERGLKALVRVLGGNQPVATNVAAAPAFDKEAHPAVPNDEMVPARQIRDLVQQEEERRQTAEQLRLEEERKQAAELEREEQERRQAAEQLRLEEERKQAAELEREEQERRQAAEQLRLEEERKQAAERAHLEEEQRRAAEKARLEEIERKRQVATEKRRLEQERKAAQEKASQTTLEEQRLTTEEPRSPLEQEETEKAVASAWDASSKRSWRTIAIALCVIAVPTFLVYRAAVAPTVASGWAVGGGTVLHTEDGGRTWQQQVNLPDEKLWSITFTTPQLGWVVGNGGSILHTQDGGRTWRTQTSGTNKRLNAVTFPTSQLGWAVGDEFTILHTEDGGRTWQQQSVIARSSQQRRSDISTSLNAVTFLNSQLGWAVGSQGVILHTEDGRSWEEQNSGTTAFLLSIIFVNTQAGWAVGTGSTILHTDNGGFSWQKQSTGVRDESAVLSGVTFVTPESGWVAGGKKLLRTEDSGRTWQQQSNVDNPTSFAFVAPEVGWVVASSGIQHTENGGRTWKTQWRAPENVRLASITFVKPQ